MCYDTHMEIHHLATIQSDTRKYIEFIRTRDLSVGVYPFTSGGTEVTVEPGMGSHRFHSITEDLELLVFFAPPEGARAILSSTTI